MKNIAIIGSGSWGVALAMYLESIGNKVKIWSFDKSEADLINNDRKCKFLPNITIPEGVSCSLSYEEVIKNSDLIANINNGKVESIEIESY